MLALAHLLQQTYMRTSAASVTDKCYMQNIHITGHDHLNLSKIACKFRGVKALCATTELARPDPLQNPPRVSKINGENNLVTVICLLYE